ncbi:hypothetical protein [Bradyrhizobium sp. 21]|uniref:hypothetical protein n=1 Tax=Bradyrhizobium sp. 21 TaxID=2782666 RepID=UPI001FFB4D36|nr:hypothetical protein [Bradyrhizobium sp. 21]MCK1387876.1 hypothetical protein [Bradyrhizobium sp. 21]
MTSISAASAGNHQSPLQRLQQQLQSEVSAGTVSSSDQSALSTALTDIDKALQQSRSSDQSSGARPSKDDIKSKIDDLISNEASNGTLTSDQADELKNVFQSAFANGPGGAGGPGGTGGPPPGPPPDDSSSDSSSTDPISNTSTTSTTADILKQFLEALQQSQSSASSYGASGSSSSSSDLSALLIDYKS